MPVTQGPYGRVQQQTPPLKGSFPLDHEKECHLAMIEYMWCLHENKFQNEACRSLAKAYFQCRMDHGLMDKNEFSKLGYKDQEEPLKNIAVEDVPK